MNDPAHEIDYWRLSPDTYAQVASGGRWIRWPYLEYAARIVREAVLAGGGRVIISMPPRHGKSELFSHWMPTWYFDLWPENRILLTSYGDKLARFFGRRIKAEVVGNPSVGVKATRESHSSMEFDTQEGGGLVASGIGGAITGRGMNLGIIDDPIKTLEEAMSETMRESHVEWFKSTFYTRLEPLGSIVVIATRWHEKDLSGWLIHEHGDKWTVVNLPANAEDADPIGRTPGQALCPERYDEGSLAGIKTSIGPRLYASLYQGRPAPMEGAILKRQFWKRWRPEDLPEFEQIKQSWDPVQKEDGTSFVVGQVWGKTGSRKYLLDQIRGKWSIVEILDKIRSLSAKWSAATRKLIEAKATGNAIEELLRKEISGIILVEPKGGKEVRAMAVEPELEAGNLWIPADEVMYPWVTGFIEECATFPNGEDDDQVDSMTQAILDWRSAGSPVYGSKNPKPKRPARLMRRGGLR